MPLPSPAQDPSLAIVDTAIDLLFPALHGWCPPEKAKRMARLVLEASSPLSCPVHAVELGVFGGRGVIAMGLAVRHGLGGKGTVLGIDPFSAAASLEGTNAKVDQEWWAKLDYAMILKSAREGIAKAGLEDVVKLEIARSQDVVGRVEDGSVDVLHQDSNHSQEISCYEVETWTAKMRSGGFWIFDDIDWPTTKVAQGRLVASHGFTLIESHEKWAVFQAP